MTNTLLLNQYTRTGDRGQRTEDRYGAINIHLKKKKKEFTL